MRATLTRGKHLLTRIDHRTGEWTLHTHLKMEGSWRVFEAGRRWPKPGFQARVVLRTEKTEAVGFLLGIVELVPRDQEERLVAHLGPDILADDWDPDAALRTPRPGTRTATLRRTARPDQPGRDRHDLRRRDLLHRRDQPAAYGRGCRRPTPPDPPANPRPDAGRLVTLPPDVGLWPPGMPTLRRHRDRRPRRPSRQGAPGLLLRELPGLAPSSREAARNRIWAIRTRVSRMWRATCVRSPGATEVNSSRRMFKVSSSPKSSASSRSGECTSPSRPGDGTVRSGSSFSTAMVIAPSPHECASPWWAHVGKETERSALRHG